VFLLERLSSPDLRQAWERDSGVVAWLSEQNSNDPLSKCDKSLERIERGIVLSRKVDAVFAGVLQGWLEGLLNVYGPAPSFLSIRCHRQTLGASFQRRSRPCGA